MYPEVLEQWSYNTFFLQTFFKNQLLGASLVFGIPNVPEQLSPCATTTEPVFYSLGATTAKALIPRAHTLQQEKSQQ